MSQKIGQILFFSLLAFLCVILIQDIFGVNADTASTSVTVTGGAPATPTSVSDGGVTSTNPVNVGSTITFTGTADDPNGDQYYLAVCKSNAISANNNATPTCTGGEFCYSVPTNDNAQATCATTAAAYMAETSTWYMFACDKVASSQCSASTQGTGDNGSPVHVNHAPTFSDATNDGPKNPGQTLTITATASDGDVTHSDTVKLVVCKTQGVSGTACDGGDSDTWCTSSLAASNPSCGFTVPTPAAHGASSSYVYVFDSHNFAAGGAVQNTEEQFTVNDVAPTVTVSSFNNGATINVATGGEGPTGNVNIYATGSVADNNGCTDVAAVTSSAYTTNVAASGCTAAASDNNTCIFNVSCTAVGSCTAGTTRDYSCTYNYKFHSSPTDDSTPLVSQTWKNSIYAKDGAPQIGSDEVDSGVELQSFVSLDMTAAIAYGSLTVGQITDSDTLPQITYVTSTGNTGIDIYLKGSAMNDGGSNNIVVGAQKYATSSATQYGQAAAIALTGSDAELELNVKKPTTTTALPFGIVRWGLKIPDGTLAGTYSGTVTTTALMAETADW